MTVSVEVEVMLPSTVFRTVCLGVGHPTGAHNQVIFLFVWQLRVSWYGATSLTRGWVCNLLVQLLPDLASSDVQVQWNSWQYFTAWFEIFPIRLRIYIPQEQGGPVIPPGCLRFRFRFRLFCDRRSVGQCLGVRPPSGAVTRFLLLSDIAVFLLRGALPAENTSL
jgi:hypothetical protein